MSDPLDSKEWRRLLSPISVYLQPRVGGVANDREGTGRVLIVSKTDATADETVIDGLDMTVAEENPEYPQDDAVFSCVYLESLPEQADEFGTAAVAKDVKRREIAQYDFPESRLEMVAPDRITLGDFERGAEE